MLPIICGIGGDPGYRAVLRFSAAAHLWTGRSVQVSVESGAQPISLRSVELLRLSTHFEYDGENLREVTGPDGARQRVEHDRLGRPQVWMAADGTWVQCFYDSLDRPIRLLDSEGVEQRYEFAAVGNLNSFRLVFREATQNADAIRVELSVCGYRF